MSRARELAKVGGKNQQIISGLSSHVGVSTFLNNVHMFANLDVGGNVVVTGTTTFNGGTLTLGDANTDNIVFGGEVDSNIVPDDDNSFDLGSSTKEWKDLFIDGTAHIDTLDVDENAAVAGNLNVTGTATFSTALANSNLANSTVSYGGIELALGATDATPAFNLTDATNYPTSSLVGTITNAQLAGSIANAKLANSTVSFGGISLALGGTDATPAFDLSDATNYPTSSLSGTITNAQLAGSIANDKLAGSIANNKLANSTVSYGGVSLALGGTDATPAFNLADATGLPISSGVSGLAANVATFLGTPSSANLRSVLTDETGTGAAVFGTSPTIATPTLTGTAVAANLDISGAVDIDGHLDVDNVSVAGVSTFASGVTITGALDANGGASIDNVQVGVTNDNEIDTSSGNLVLDSAGGTVTVDDNLTVSGNLTVNGTTTTINSTTVAIDDKNFQVATGAADDAAADGAGLTVDSGDGDKTFNFEATGDNWGASENLNLASGKVYKINNSSILSATALGSSVVSSSLTSVGTITSGVWQGTAIANSSLANSTVSFGGITLSLGGTDATPAFDLTDATNYPTSSLSGTITNAQLAGSIASGKLASTGVSAGTVGSSTAIPIITVNAQGQITNTSTTAIDSTTIENGTASVAVAENGPITSTGNHDFTAGIDVTGNITVSGTVDGADVASMNSKLSGIESGATADQTAAEIRTLVGSASDSNVFTDALKSKLDGIAASATNVTNTNQLTNGAGFITATLTNEQVQDIVGGMVSSNTESGITVTYQDGDGTLDFAVASQTDNNFTNADHSKLDGIEAGATADQTASEILALIKSVDGPGSGLNADTLDGISSASFLRSDTSDTFNGTLTVNGNILPNANGTRDLGANGTRWANIYTSDVDLNNQAKGGNTIDGSWGSYLIEEGENDLFLKNRRSGKTYKFMLQEV